MQPVYQNPDVPTTESVYRTNFTGWAAMLMTQLLLLIVLYFVKPQVFGFSSLAPSTTANAAAIASETSISNLPIIILIVLGLTTFVLSFVIRTRLLRYAIDNKDIKLVQSAQIAAYALGGATSLLGLIAAFAFDFKYFFVWFIAGILGILLHFPRKNDFAAAAFKGVT